MYTYSTCMYLQNKKYTLLWVTSTKRRYNSFLSKTECSDFYTLILLILKWLHNLVSNAFISFLSLGGGGWLPWQCVHPQTNPATLLWQLTTGDIDSKWTDCTSTHKLDIPTMKIWTVWHSSYCNNLSPRAVTFQSRTFCLILAYQRLWRIVPWFLGCLIQISLTLKNKKRIKDETSHLNPLIMVIYVKIVSWDVCLEMFKWAQPFRKRYCTYRYEMF